MMRAEWKYYDRDSVRLVAGYTACVERFGEDRYYWTVVGVQSASGIEPTEAAAKLAAETEMRRRVGEMVEALGGTVNWNAATPQEG